MMLNPTLIPPRLAVIEPDTALREQIAAAFAAEGWGVHAVGEVAALLALLGRGGAEGAFDLIVGVNPADLPVLMQRPARISVLAITDGTPSSIDAALSGGAADYVTRPVHLPTLVFRVRRLLHSQQAAAETQFKRQLFSHIGDAVVVLNPQHQVVFINEAAAVLFSTTPEAAYGKPLTSFYTIEWETPHQREESLAAVHSGETWRQEVWIRTGAGQRRFVDALVRVLRDPDGQPAGLIGTLRDITDRKRSEDAAQAQRLLADTLRETAAALTRSLDPQAVMQLILEQVGRVVPHRAANIMLTQGDLLRPAYLHGYSPDAQRVMETQFFKLSERLFAVMMATGSSIVLDHVQEHPDWRDLPYLDWQQSYVGTPIRAYDHVIGFLNLYSDQPSAFTQQHADNLQAFADQAAIAVENAQLYDAVFRDAVEMRALHRATSFLFSADLIGASDLRTIATQIAAAVVREFNKVDCGIFLTEENGQLLRRYARAGEFQARTPDTLRLDAAGALGSVVRGGRALYIRDTAVEAHHAPIDARTRSQLVIPLKSLSRAGVIGVLDLQSAEVDAFTKQDQRMLQAFAERAAASLENVRLYQEIQQRVDERTAEVTRVKERVEAILNHSSDAIIMLHPDGTIRQTNHTFDQMVGLPPDGAFGRPLASFFSPAQQTAFLHALDTVFAQQTSRRLEITVVPRTAAVPVEVDLSISPIRHGGGITGVVVSLRDITERKRLEDELRAALDKERELNHLRAGFIARASHSFRTPLAVIQTSSDLITRYADRLTAEQRQSHAASLRAALHQIVELLDDLLLLSRSGLERPDQLRRAPVALTGLLQEALDAVIASHAEAAERLRLIVEADEAAAVCHGDADLLRHVFTNLMINGLKYSDAPHPITLTLRVVDNVAQITIADQGRGIPPEDLPHIFDPFYRGHNVGYVQGTGLGLTIVKDGVDLHGGSVTCTSRPAEGTTFTVLLPLTAAAVTRHSEQVKAE